MFNILCHLIKPDCKILTIFLLEYLVVCFVDFLSDTCIIFTVSAVLVEVHVSSSHEFDFVRLICME